MASKKLKTFHCWHPLSFLFYIELSAVCSTDVKAMTVVLETS